MFHTTAATGKPAGSAATSCAILLMQSRERTPGRVSALVSRAVADLATWCRFGGGVLSGMNPELISKTPTLPAHATPLLFIHGAFHGAWCWDEHFLDYFAQHGFSAYSLSLRGHGGRFAAIEPVS